MPRWATVDEYLVAVPEPARSALAELRAVIKSVAPTATETIAYDMPAFRQDGRFLVSFAAYKRHCSLYPASEGVMGQLEERLNPYLSGKGTLRFTPEEPIPDALVRRIVEIRLSEVIGAAT